MRELRNAIERAVVNANGETIRAADLPAAVRGDAPDVVDADIASFHVQRTNAERRIVLAALERHKWQITRTAESLSISRTTRACSRSCAGLASKKTRQDLHD